MSIRGVLFDFDGTLTEPGSLDFSRLRQALSCPKERPILEFIAGLPSEVARVEALRILNDYEVEAARNSRPNAGAEEVVLRLHSRGLKLGIVSRNSMSSILSALDNFKYISASVFEIILSRDDSLPPKPSPDPVLACAHRMGIPAGQLLMVGDYVFDVEAGQRAGAHTVFLTNGSPLAKCPVLPDFTIDHLEEVCDILDLFLPLPAGKLPNFLLEKFLADLSIADPSLLISPGVGEDIAAVCMQDEEVLVLKSDPITFATDEIASYAVAVNMNDVATCGAVPRWITASLLFPPGTCAAQIRKVMIDLNRLSRENGLILCGGHTEITEAVTRPVVAGQIIGTASRGGLIDKRKLRPGDIILLTKAIAIEGTCILARELPRRLQELGLSGALIERCRRLLYDPGISIVPEARIAANSGRVTAMHDVTEGGLATALEELSAAGRRRLRIYLDRIPVLEETQLICGLLGINPLGLIGSGSLLITCDASSAEDLARNIRRAGIRATVIGEVLEQVRGIEAGDECGKAAHWPVFQVDEIARYFCENAPTPGPS